MNPLAAYRDAGPLADLLARAAPVPPRRAPLLTAAGTVPLLLVAALALPSRPALVVAGLLFVLCAGLAGDPAGPLAWAVPPLLRLGEYAYVLRAGVLAGPGGVPAAFALLAALAYAHYTAVYRLQLQRLAPPRWLALAGGGWSLRIPLAGLLLLAGGTRVGLYAAAAALALLHVGDSVAGWTGSGRQGRAV